HREAALRESDRWAGLGQSTFVVFLERSASDAEGARADGCAAVSGDEGPAAMNDARPEVWLRGPLPDYIDELQPAAHSLLQVREEIEAVLALPQEKLWMRPGGAASIGFHLKHLAGSLDRLLTYASGKQLSAAQRQTLADEQDIGSG